jgi:hypothetical protein
VSTKRNDEQRDNVRASIDALLDSITKDLVAVIEKDHSFACGRRDEQKPPSKVLHSHSRAPTMAELAPPRQETTLDEPVWQTVVRSDQLISTTFRDLVSAIWQWRDAAMVGKKVFHVVWPFGKGVRVLRDCTIYSSLFFSRK